MLSLRYLTIESLGLQHFQFSIVFLRGPRAMATLHPIVNVLKTQPALCLFLHSSESFQMRRGYGSHGTDGLRACGGERPHRSSCCEVFSVVKNVHHAQNRIMTLWADADDDARDYLVTRVFCLFAFCYSSCRKQLFWVLKSGFCFLCKIYMKKNFG